MISARLKYAYILGSSVTGAAFYAAVAWIGVGPAAIVGAIVAGGGAALILRWVDSAAPVVAPPE